MSRIEGAMDQLRQALDRLEGAVGRRSAERGGDKALRETQALREDRSRLAQALEGARADYAALDAVSEEVEERLDGAIRDIRRLLGGAA